MTSICSSCAFSRWDRTKSGSLHPSGNGRCEFYSMTKKEIVFPASFRWITLSGRPEVKTNIPRNLGGGAINRKSPRFTTCPTYSAIS